MYQANANNVEVDSKHFQNEYLNIEILMMSLYCYYYYDLTLNFDACIHFDLLEVLLKVEAILLNPF